MKHHIVIDQRGGIDRLKQIESPILIVFTFICHIGSDENDSSKCHLMTNQDRHYDYGVNVRFVIFCGVTALKVDSLDN